MATMVTMATMATMATKATMATMTLTKEVAELLTLPVNIFESLQIIRRYKTPKSSEAKCYELSLNTRFCNKLNHEIMIV